MSVVLNVKNEGKAGLVAFGAISAIALAVGYSIYTKAKPKQQGITTIPTSKPVGVENTGETRVSSVSTGPVVAQSTGPSKPEMIVPTTTLASKLEQALPAKEQSSSNQKLQQSMENISVEKKVIIPPTPIKAVQSGITIPIGPFSAQATSGKLSEQASYEMAVIQHDQALESKSSVSYHPVIPAPLPAPPSVIPPSDINPGRSSSQTILNASALRATGKLSPTLTYEELVGLPSSENFSPYSLSKTYVSNLGAKYTAKILA